MLKSALLASALCLAFVSPAMSAPWQCDEANLKEMNDYVGKLDSKASQEAGASEMKLAMDALNAKNTEECTMRMTNVNKMLGGKDLERNLNNATDKTITAPAQ